MFHLISKRKYKKKTACYQFMKTEEYKAVAKSKLFDKQWYLSKNPDVKKSGIDPIEHYLKFGWKEARECTPYFDGNEYLRMYPDVAKANVNPLVHWELYGKKEGRFIINRGNVNIIERIKNNCMKVSKELMAKFSWKEISHKIADKCSKKYKGKSQDYKLIAKSKYFNKRWYLKQYPDVKKAGVDPVEHYMKYGWKEGRNPSNKFDGKAYLNNHIEAKQIGLCPLLRDTEQNTIKCSINVEYTNNPQKYRQVRSYLNRQNLFVEYYNNATILPIIKSEKGWFKGGVVDADNNYIKISSLEPNEIIYDDYKIEKQEKSSLEVVYIGGMLNHYGHFIIECTSRIYPFISDSRFKNKIFAYTTVNNEKLHQQYIDFFNLLGIEERQLLHVKKTTLFKKVIIPSVSTVSGAWFTNEFKDIYNKVVESIKPIYNDKIYFSRRKLNKAINSEFGEELIEKIFLENGYKVIYPEKLPLTQQIALIKGCKNFACINGSLAHNMLYAEDKTSIIIINKMSQANGSQKIVNEMRNLNVTYVDAYIECPYVSMGKGPFIVVPSKNLYKFCKDHKFKITINKKQITDNINNYIKTYIEYAQNNSLTKQLDDKELDNIVSNFCKNIICSKKGIIHYKGEDQKQYLEKYSSKINEFRLIEKSKYFDKKWYLRTYPDVKKAGVDPVEHYMKYGWKEGRNPSKKFDTEGYMKRYSNVTINPLLHYEIIGKKEKYQVGSYINEIAINNYFINYEKSKKEKKVIYSCISGKYDDIVTDFYPNEDYDYVLFTDNKKLLKQKQFLFWKIRPMKFTERDSVRNARWHKMHPHILFPDYEYSVWIDSNVQILGREIYNYIDEQIAKNHNIATTIHPYRNCLYEEAWECIRKHKDNAELICKQIDIIREDGFPKEMGLFETNVFYRKHNDSDVISLMEQWWSFINNLSRRDQLSFSYLLWKNSVKCYSLSDKPLRFHSEFKLKQHNYFPLCKGHNVKSCEKNKILVHLHLYYHDQLDYFIKKLKNITCYYDLYVTMVDLDNKVVDKLKKFKSDVEIVKVANRGYDIWPFIFVINMVNLNDYDYIIKLHTKNYRTSVWSYNGVNYIYYQWRNALVDALLKNKRVFNHNLNVLSQGIVGMIGNKDLISHKGAKDNENYRLMLCEKLGYKPENDKYIAGTMFMCASFLMKDIQNLDLSENDFDVTQNTGMVGTLAHAMESILGHTSQNYNLEIYGNGFFSVKNVIINIRKKYITYCKNRKKNDYNVIKKSRFFNKKWYLKQYPDVKKAKVDPVEHYIKYGWKEGCNPSKKFNTNEYLDRNKDVKNAKVNPLLHYERFGKYEGRKLKIENLYDDCNLKIRLKNNKRYGVLEEKRATKIIISLTSFPARIDEVTYTIYSLLDQSVKPDEIVLWLGYDKFPNREENLPDILLNLQNRGLTIKWCKDLRSYTKLIPSLKMYPNDVIVTADDDVYYPKDWLKMLIKQHQKYPENIICHRAHFIRRNEDGTIKKYNEWELSTKMVRESYYNFLTGVGGVLYPPRSLYKDVLKSSLFQKLAPLADDIWFWAMAVLNGTKIRNIEKGYTKLVYINEAREMGLIEGQTLALQNVLNNKNDEQLRNVFIRYPELYKKLGIKKS